MPVGWRAPMIFLRLQKNRLTTKIFILFIVLQMSACSTEESSTAAGQNSGTSAATDIKLSWIPPAEREDNSPIQMSEIAGYKVYYGTAEGLYPSSVLINDGYSEGYTFTNLPIDTYYFVITTLDTEGRESQYSPEVVVSI